MRQSPARSGVIMERIREILLTNYIGAVTIGLVLAQAIFGFVNALVQTAVSYWTISQSRGVMGAPTQFQWSGLIVSMVTVFLYLLVCFSLIRWLYVEPRKIEDEVTDDTPGRGSES